MIDVLLVNGPLKGNFKMPDLEVLEFPNYDNLSNYDNPSNLKFVNPNSKIMEDELDFKKYRYKKISYRSAIDKKLINNDSYSYYLLKNNVHLYEIIDE